MRGAQLFEEEYGSSPEVHSLAAEGIQVVGVANRRVVEGRHWVEQLAEGLGFQREAERHIREVELFI